MKPQINFLIACACLLAGSVASAAKCAQSDTVLSQNPTSKTVRCVAPLAFCMAYDLDDMSGMYRNFVGYHKNLCAGEMKRDAVDYVCKRADGSTYNTVDIVTNSKCDVGGQPTKANEKSG